MDSFIWGIPPDFPRGHARAWLRRIRDRSRSKFRMFRGWRHLFAEADGLMSYGTEWIDLFGRVLVEEPTKFELVINLKTDKALGLTIPQSLLQRSD
jgi:hypothetical protein